MTHDVLQIVGALLVLTGYAASQLGLLSPKSVGYLTVNIAGAGLLAWLAWTSRDWGFLLLEGVWTLVSAVALAVLLRSGDGGAAAGHRSAHSGLIDSSTSASSSGLISTSRALDPSDGPTMPRVSIRSISRPALAKPTRSLRCSMLVEPS